MPAARLLIAGLSRLRVAASGDALLGPRAEAAGLRLGSVSGSILAVCSCTVLPLSRASIAWAQARPATAFLYSGPAINVLAIVLTARCSARRSASARRGAVSSRLIGLLMATIFRREEQAKCGGRAAAPEAAGRCGRRRLSSRCRSGSSYLRTGAPPRRRRVLRSHVRPSSGGHVALGITLALLVVALSSGSRCCASPWSPLRHFWSRWPVPVIRLAVPRSGLGWPGSRRT